jgi:maltose alpha-D-glucosyltransferase/alpha-amylase
MRYSWRNNSVLCVHNLDSGTREVGLRIQDNDERECSLVNLLSDDHSHAEDGLHRIVLESYGYRWYRVCGLDYLLKRSIV